VPTHPHLLESEDPAAYAALLHALTKENESASTLETQLLHRLAITFWKQTRADRLEAKLFASDENDPEASFDLARFNAVRHYQAGLARDATRLLRELRTLRRERNKPEQPPVRKEPKAGSARKEPDRQPPRSESDPPANDHAAGNEPGRPPLNRHQCRRLAALLRAG
jgi:hypothetical protein